MLNFDQVGSRNLDKLLSNLVNRVLAILFDLVNFGSFCSIIGSFCYIYINWVLANLATLVQFG